MSILSYELTNPQKSILLTEQFNKNTSVSNICGTLSITEKINVDALEKAINLFIQHNDSVRINLFEDGSEIKQFIKNYSFVDIEKISITKQYPLSKLEEDVISKPFTLFNNDLYRFVIFVNSDGTGGFMANLHHIISDAWTMSLLIDQIMSYYASLIQNSLIENIKNNSYINFIHDEQKYIESPKFERAKEFWEHQFDNLEFSYLKDFQSSSYEAIRKSVTLSKAETDTLVNFCNNHKTSLFSLFMAVLNIYLSKINNTSSSIVGTPILNRSNFKEKTTTGMYISTIPFRMEIDKELTIELKKMKERHNTILDPDELDTGLKTNHQGMYLSSLMITALSLINCSNVSEINQWIDSVPNLYMISQLSDGNYSPEQIDAIKRKLFEIYQESMISTQVVNDINSNNKEDGMRYALHKKLSGLNLSIEDELKIGNIGLSEGLPSLYKEIENICINKFGQEKGKGDSG